MNDELIKLWWQPLFWALLGLLFGLIADLFLHRYFRRLAATTTWRGDDLIVKLLASRMPLIGFLAGLLVALPQLPLSEKVQIGLIKGVHVALVLVVTWIASAVAGGLIALSSESEERRSSTSIFRILAQVGIWVVGFTAALYELGVSIAPLLTALGVGGLALALAMQDTLSNLFAGIQVLLAKQVRVGDYIRLESGAEGYVSDISWRSTTIHALPNNLIIVPNSKLASSITTNFHLPNEQCSVLVEVGASYVGDLDQVERIAIEVAREVMQTVPGGIPDHEPSVRFHTFGDNAINFTMILRASEYRDQYLIKHEFIKRLHLRFKEEGIEIPLPQRVVTIASCSDSKVEKQ